VLAFVANKRPSIDGIRLSFDFSVNVSELTKEVASIANKALHGYFSAFQSG